MFRRIFVGMWIQRANLAALIFLVAWGITLVTYLAMICLPINKLWDPLADGHCIDFVPAFFAPAVINMITDFSIFILPLPAIRQLQLPLRQKIILSFILCLGLFTCIISIVRLSTLDAAATSADTTWDNTGAALWSYLELTVAIMAACLPTLRPFVNRFFPKLMASSSRNGGGANGSAPPTGPDGALQTWGGSGGPNSSTPSGQYSKVGDSTDALYADPEIGMDVLSSRSSIGGGSPGNGSGTGTGTTANTGPVYVDKPPPIHSYRESVARRGHNETTIGTGTGRRSQGSDEIPANVKKAAVIRATTTIKQEYQ